MILSAWYIILEAKYMMQNTWCKIHETWSIKSIVILFFICFIVKRQQQHKQKHEQQKQKQRQQQHEQQEK